MQSQGLRPVCLWRHTEFVPTSGGKGKKTWRPAIARAGAAAADSAPQELWHDARTKAGESNTFG